MTTSGLPTARHQLPTGTDRQDFVDYNRALKVARIVAKALELGADCDLADEQMDAIAHEIGVNLPGSQETRDAIRRGLAEPLLPDDPNKDFWYAVTAASEGLPFRYRDDSGHTVLLVPIPVDR
jgi:hypothetical protein